MCGAGPRQKTPPTRIALTARCNDVGEKEHVMLGSPLRRMEEGRRTFEDVTAVQGVIVAGSLLVAKTIAPVVSSPESAREQVLEGNAVLNTTRTAGCLSGVRYDQRGGRWSVRAALGDAAPRS